jgi:hypothetical protein
MNGNIMYSYKEIDLAFENCKNWDELEKVCNTFAYLITLDIMSNIKIWHIRTKSNERFRQLENL